jgi:molybdate/tungstate transport system ATP-binding protein
VLELHSLVKRLGAFCLSGVTLEVAEGQYFVLLGPSGVGKTVLLELVAGLLHPDEGRILFRNEDITNRAPETRGFGLVYQDYALFPHLDVGRNVAYGLRMCGVPAGEAVRRVRSLAEKLGFVNLLERSPETLSGGERQRVALGRALARKPALLLLDEPLAALDANTRVELRRELKRVQRDTQATFLHVTHDPEEALFLADRVGVMLDSRIRQVGSPEDLFRRPTDAHVGAFLGMKNFVRVDGTRPGCCVVNGAEVYAAAVDGPVSHLWIKPEEILLSLDPFASSARNQFRGRVTSCEPSGILLAVRVDVGALELTALVTHESFHSLQLVPGRDVFCTFKSSAVHCF